VENGKRVKMEQASGEKRILLIHPTGNANVRQAALALEQAGMLACFHTAIAWHPGSALERLLSPGLRAELGRRSFPGIPAARIHTHPWRELMRIIASRYGWNGLTRNETGRFSFDAVAWEMERKVAAQVRRGPAIDAVYAYDTCALAVLEAAQARGCRRIFDQPTGYYRAALQISDEERELKPEWASTISGIHDSAEKFARKDREIALADSIVVASSFTAETLKAYPGGISVPVHRIPYGAPPAGEPRRPTGRNEPLRVLFVGQMGQRKGLGYLIEAMERLAVPATLTLLGRPLDVPLVLRQALERHRWIESAPHGEVLRRMREHDVLVFPSLFDGFGLVILEAMAQGTVVIATPNTAAPDLLDDGRDGFIVPIRSADAIAARLTQLAEDRDLLVQMSEAARQKAAQCTWDEFRRKLVKAVTATIG
jgi:alpha-maltose-1-phosphate synthase